MTIQEIVAEIPHLTVEERLVLLETITQSLRATRTPRPPVDESLVERLYGAFRSGNSSPTDEEIEHMRYDALLEKYS